MVGVAKQLDSDDKSLLAGFANFLSATKSVNTQKSYLTDIVVFCRELFPEHWRMHKKFNPVALDVAVQYVMNEFEEQANLLPAEAREQYKKALPAIRKVAKSIKHKYGLKPMIRQKGNILHMNLNPVPETPLEELIDVNEKDIDLVQSVFRGNLGYMGDDFFSHMFDFETMGSVLGHLREHHYNSMNTISRKISALRQFELFLENKGLVDKIRLHKFPLPRKQKKAQQYLEYENLVQVIRRIPTEFTESWRANLWIRDKAMLYLIFGSGARANELCSVHNEDVKQDELFIRDAKGGGTRTAAIPPKTRELLDIYEKHREKIYTTIQEPEYYFLNKSGKRIDRRSVYRIFQKHLFLNNITDKIGPHSIRHTVATFMNDNEVPLTEIQRWLGHSQPTTTMIYIDRIKKQKPENIKRYHPEG